MTNYQKYENALQFLEVFEDGSVYRKERTWVNGKGGVQYQSRQLAKTYINRTGYKKLYLDFGGKNQKQLFVHRLVATAYIPKPEGWDETWEVNHINGVKTDNRVENLEWTTRSGNVQHAYRTGLKNAKIVNKKRVQQIDLNTGDIINEFESASEAARVVNTSGGNIATCCRGQHKIIKGYGWRYANEYIS